MLLMILCWQVGDLLIFCCQMLSLSFSTILHLG
jgi:hypothetical protein